ncbi:hypothetical protein ABZ299_15190 [Streptomyces sp. NPDC006184]|uniref:hypothetical protein n=1 Tax=Streptomyces sp. NPDC006184 TaxID=3155455 RepID=UPI0033ADA6AB
MLILEDRMAPTPILPIVYVRRYAGDAAGSDEVVTDPFHGVDQGSTHTRVGPGDTPCSRLAVPEQEALRILVPRLAMTSPWRPLWLW